MLEQVKEPSPLTVEPKCDTLALEQGVRQLGMLYGIGGLEIVTQPGAGWSCAKTEHGLTITVDPQQTLQGHSKEQPDKVKPEVPAEITTLYIAGHELGHAKDFLDRLWKKPEKRTPAGDFFDCLIDDTVIDKRSRRIPLFDAYADAIYKHQIPTDLTAMPKHTQLLYAIRNDTVITNSEVIADPKITTIVESLKAYQKDGSVFNILKVLVDHRTSLSERRRIANNFILPHYEALLEQDKEDAGSKAEAENQAQKVYDLYEQNVHGHHHESKDEDEGASEKTSNEQSSEGESTLGSLSEQISDALSQIAAEQAAEQVDQAKTKAKAKAEAQAAAAHPSKDEAGQHKARLSQLAGTVAEEMKLSSDDAESYVRALDKSIPIIREVADVFMRLAAPTNVIMSPRYSARAHSNGARLHTRTLAGVALQLETDQDQAIWQPIVRRANRQEIAFGGLDVHLLVDVSGSMSENSKAECASATSLCLSEGLDLARHKVASTTGKFHQPDVRTQIIAFGSGSEVLSPLSHQSTPQQKGKTYTNVLHPVSSSTLIYGALENVKQAALGNLQRDNIVIIISDGQFGDYGRALETMASMPKSVYATHLVVGGEASQYISSNHEAVSEPASLPGKLAGVLAAYIRKSR